ncbi:hypothetical protein AAG570_011042 [Ranatra chinensis]|uniref:Uncharacterized protein n=1 Tax=Ranatra chinensis TaxID=642074 RepID=A0ABD0YJN9_9HEMI
MKVMIISQKFIFIRILFQYLTLDSGKLEECCGEGRKRYRGAGSFQQWQPPFKNFVSGRINTADINYSPPIELEGYGESSAISISSQETVPFKRSYVNNDETSSSHYSSEEEEEYIRRHLDKKIEQFEHFDRPVEDSGSQGDTLEGQVCKNQSEDNKKFADNGFNAIKQSIVGHKTDVGSADTRFQEHTESGEGGTFKFGECPSAMADRQLSTKMLKEEYSLDLHKPYNRHKEIADDCIFSTLQDQYDNKDYQFEKRPESSSESPGRCVYNKDEGEIGLRENHFCKGTDSSDVGTICVKNNDSIMAKSQCTVNILEQEIFEKKGGTSHENQPYDMVDKRSKNQAPEEQEATEVTGVRDVNDSCTIARSLLKISVEHDPVLNDRGENEGKIVTSADSGTISCQVWPSGTNDAHYVSSASSKMTVDQAKQTFTVSIDSTLPNNIKDGSKDIIGEEIGSMSGTMEEDNVFKTSPTALCTTIQTEVLGSSEEFVKENTLKFLPTDLCKETLKDGYKTREVTEEMAPKFECEGFETKKTLDKYTFENSEEITNSSMKSKAGGGTSFKPRRLFTNSYDDSMSKFPRGTKSEDELIKHMDIDEESETKENTITEQVYDKLLAETDCTFLGKRTSSALKDCVGMPGSGDSQSSDSSSKMALVKSDQKPHAMGKPLDDGNGNSPEPLDDMKIGTPPDFYNSLYESEKTSNLTSADVGKLKVIHCTGESNSIGEIRPDSDIIQYKFSDDEFEECSDSEFEVQLTKKPTSGNSNSISNGVSKISETTISNNLNFAPPIVDHKVITSTSITKSEHVSSPLSAISEFVDAMYSNELAAENSSNSTGRGKPTSNTSPVEPKYDSKKINFDLLDTCQNISSDRPKINRSTFEESWSFELVGREAGHESTPLNSGFDCKTDKEDSMSLYCPVEDKVKHTDVFIKPKVDYPRSEYGKVHPYELEARKSRMLVEPKRHCLPYKGNNPAGSFSDPVEKRTLLPNMAFERTQVNRKSSDYERRNLFSHGYGESGILTISKPDCKSHTKNFRSDNFPVRSDVRAQSSRERHVANESSENGSQSIRKPRQNVILAKPKFEYPIDDKRFVCPTAYQKQTGGRTFQQKRSNASSGLTNQTDMGHISGNELELRGFTKKSAARQPQLPSAIGRNVGGTSAHGEKQGAINDEFDQDLCISETQMEFLEGLISAKEQKSAVPQKQRLFGSDQDKTKLDTYKHSLRNIITELDKLK